MQAASPVGRITAAAVAAGALAALTALSCRLAAANLLFVVVVAATWLALRRGELAGRASARPLLAPLAGFGIASLLATAFSLNPLLSLDQLPRLAFFALVPLAAALLDERWWDRTVAAIAVVAAVLAGIGIFQYLTGPRDLEHRISGPMSHYMTYSGWLLLAILLLTGELILRPRLRRAWLVAPATLALVALLLTYTRNAWVGLGVGGLLLAVVWRRRLLLAYPLIALAVWMFAPTAVLDRMVSTFDLRQHSNYDRLCMVVSGAQMVSDRPWTGVGPGMVKELYPLYRRDDAPRWRVPHLHNNPLQIAAERGLLGLAAYLWLLGAFFTSTWRALPRLVGPARAAVGATFVAVGGITVAGLFEYNFWDAEIQFLTLVLAGVGAGRAESAAAAAALREAA